MYLIKFQPDDHYVDPSWTIGYIEHELTAKTYCDNWNVIQKTAIEYYDMFNDETREEYKDVSEATWDWIDVPKWKAGIHQDEITFEMRAERNRIKALNERISERNNRITERWERVRRINKLRRIIKADLPKLVKGWVMYLMNNRWSDYRYGKFQFSKVKKLEIDTPSYERA